jgi:myosin tail region-interacting protein MTI1
MADPPPPRPKPGSLRDRIAAFENKPAPTPPPPAPRSKPGGLTWKPKPQSPPASPGQQAASPAPPLSAGTDDRSPVSPERRLHSGMSASDARDSIGKAGGLRERMAALQGKGAFGAPPPIAPKPAIERPKWKPPPQVTVPQADDKQDSPTRDPHPADAPAGIQSSVQPSVTEDSPTPEVPENDVVEEERRRRAAIAARMARLGGARVGLAPPVLGKKPLVPKVETPKEDVPPVQTLKDESPSVASNSEYSIKYLMISL